MIRESDMYGNVHPRRGSEKVAIVHLPLNLSYLVS